MLKIGETAKLLDCTPATLRNYVKRFPEYLSPDATSQRRKRFSDKDISTLQKIKSLLDDGYKYDEVPEMLDDVSLDDVIPEILDTHEQVNTHDEPFSQDTAIAPIEYFEHIRNLLEGEREQHEKHLQAKDEFIEHLQGENQRLREQLERERLPWWRKLRG